MRARKRILYVDDVTLMAGGANSFLTLFRCIDRSEYELFLVCPEGPLAQAARGLGVQTFDYTFVHPYFKVGFLGRRILNPFPLVFRLKDSYRLSHIARQLGIHLIHTNNLNSHITGLFTGRMTGVPVLWHIRSYWPSLLYRFMLPDKIIFVSKAVMDRGCGERGRARCQVLYNGIREDSFQRVPGAYGDVRREFGLLPEDKIVGIVGRLCPWKGHRCFIEAARCLLDSGVAARFMIVGDQLVSRGRVKQELADLTHRLGLDDAVTFTGFRTDIARLLSSFDVFVSASKDDPNPRAVLEAMAVGLPIIGTRSGGVPEMIEDNVSGLLVRPEDSRDLAGAISRLLANPGLAARLASAAHRRVSTLFRASVHVQEVERVYEELLS
jgi:glycosyltransferase involved in cell wall biosynthesis